MTNTEVRLSSSTASQTNESAAFKQVTPGGRIYNITSATEITLTTVLRKVTGVKSSQKFKITNYQHQYYFEFNICVYYASI